MDKGVWEKIANVQSGLGVKSMVVICAALSEVRQRGCPEINRPDLESIEQSIDFLRAGFAHGVVHGQPGFRSGCRANIEFSRPRKTIEEKFRRRLAECDAEKRG